MSYSGEKGAAGNPGAAAAAPHTNSTQRDERDTIPRQVAIEMLCKPGMRMTNRERKMYMRALEIHNIPTATPRLQRRWEILANRLKSRSLLHVVKREKRCRAMRKLLKHAHLIGNRQLNTLGAVDGKSATPNAALGILLLQKQLALLAIKIKELDLAWECAITEIDRRQKAMICVAGVRS